jgi:hypothetical protein
MGFRRARSTLSVFASVHSSEPSADERGGRNVAFLEDGFRDCFLLGLFLRLRRLLLLGLETYDVGASRLAHTDDFVIHLTSAIVRLRRTGSPSAFALLLAVFPGVFRASTGLGEV